MLPDRINELQVGEKNRRFHFETSWLLDESCEEVVKHAWENSTGEILVGRIASMAQGLKQWSSVKFKNLGKQIADTEKALAAAQLLPISDTMCRTCTDLGKKLDDLHEKHEAYWYLRSRIAEIRDGDRNTTYFHHKASQRRKRNFVQGLFDDFSV